MTLRIRQALNYLVAYLRGDYPGRQEGVWYGEDHPLYLANFSRVSPWELLRTRRWPRHTGVWKDRSIGDIERMRRRIVELAQEQRRMK